MSLILKHTFILLIIAHVAAVDILRAHQQSFQVQKRASHRHPNSGFSRRGCVGGHFDQV